MKELPLPAPTVKDNINEYKDKHQNGITVSIGMSLDFVAMIPQIAFEATVREYLRRTNRREFTDNEITDYIKANPDIEMNRLIAELEQLPKLQ